MPKKKKKTEKKDLSIPELEVVVRDLNREIYQLRNELAINRKLEKPHELRAKRKDLARALTQLTQQQRGKEVGKGA